MGSQMVNTSQNCSHSSTADENSFTSSEEDDDKDCAQSVFGGVRGGGCCSDCFRHVRNFFTDYGDSPLAGISLLLFDGEEFFASEWQDGIEPHAVYVVYRWLFLLLVLAIPGLATALKEDGLWKHNFPAYFYYLFNWQLAYFMPYAFLAALLVTARYSQHRRLKLNCTVDSCLVSILGLLQVLSYALKPYYLLIFLTIYDQPSGMWTDSRIYMFLLPGLLAYLDLMIVGSPARLLHIAFPSLVLAVYILCTAYHLATEGLSYEAEEAIYLELGPLSNILAGYAAIYVPLFVLSYAFGRVLYCTRRRLKRTKVHEFPSAVSMNLKW